MTRDEARGQAVAQATPEMLEQCIIISSTSHYKLVVLPIELREAFDTNYGIVHKEYNVIEGMYGVLFAGYEILTELQSKLDECLPKPKLGLVH